MADYTTIKFDPEVAKKFKAYKLESKKNYSVLLNEMIGFFKRNNLSPSDKIDNNIIGLESLIKKRTDVIIKFIKTSESTYLLPMQILMEQIYHRTFEDNPAVAPIAKKSLIAVESKVADIKPTLSDSSATAMAGAVDVSSLQDENTRLQDELLTSKKGRDQLISEFKNVLSKVERISKFNDKFYKLNISKTEFDELTRMVKNF